MTDNDLLHQIQTVQDYSRSESASKQIEILKSMAEKDLPETRDSQHKQHGNVMHGKLSGKMTRDGEKQVEQLHKNATQLKTEKYLWEAEKILEKEDPESFREYKKDDLEARGFKCGYDLSKLDKETADKIYVAMGMAKENAFSMGLVKGMEQFEKDKEVGVEKEAREKEEDKNLDWIEMKHFDYGDLDKDKDGLDYDQDYDDRDDYDYDDD